MAGLKVIRTGKEPIVVWRRQRWTSMAHLINTTRMDGSIRTRCGCDVEMQVAGVDGITQTQIGSEMFIAVGCGLCRIALVRDLHDEMLITHPDAKEKLRKILKELDWKMQ